VAIVFKITAALQQVVADFPLLPALVAVEHASNVIAIAVFFMAKALAASVPLAPPSDAYG
jgi:hypothetical protein